MKLFLTSILAIAAVVSVIYLASCKSEKAKSAEESTTTESVTYENPRVPDWHKNATIYEVNMRQFTPEGTFQSFESHIPRLKEMGIDILWFMPINPISVKNRKGEMGSPYAIADYKAVNPDMGTMDDFKHMLQAIHDAGMYCIIDWVPNHTGWDNPWITEHPDWYTQDKDGNIIDPIDYNTGKSWGWTDVADLNYDNQEMRLAMIDAMKWWITDVGIDGFRVDVAHGVPVDFWAQWRDAMYALEPLFMLAEAEVPAIVNNGAFVMDYGWEMHHLLNEIAAYQGQRGADATKLVSGNIQEGAEEHLEKKTALDIDKMLAKKAGQYSKGYQMNFTSNHDENAWAGTEMSRMGEGHLAFAVLTCTFDGMPLLYTGMESAMDKRLEFFKKDEVPWGDYKYAGFYKTLFDLKHRNQALWNGEHGGKLNKINTNNDEDLYAFTREKNGDKVVVVINLSKNDHTIELSGDSFVGEYKNVFANNEAITLSEGQSMELPAWGYVVLSNK